ncbi:ATP-dependent DNA helicase RecG [Fulvivirgaceae bacterium BMA10]|uniref:ATP-dependent DNA helicase RecG n=1 Tax=Splendidivirga corallicola TaxID=3051826 RepID=A0ABT8KUF8_9BACT|nr:ATP-dependent DNA helicase RecG [Fulvivirgaceae bacterium BMA10]
MASFFETRIEFLKGVGPQKAALLNKELNIYTYSELIQHYPFRYEDRTRFYKINEINAEMPFIQIKGRIKHLETVGAQRKKRLVAYFSDGEDEIELVWFKGINWVAKKLSTGIDYVVFGKASLFGRKLNMAHPEIEPLTTKNDQGGFLQPVYSTTEKLKNRFLDSRAISKLQRALMEIAHSRIRETLPPNLIAQYRLVSKKDALLNIHFPKNQELLQRAKFRLKFEELFFVQLRLLKLKVTRLEKFRGQIFDDTSKLTEFYHKHLPFDLTNAQKRVIKEIYRDMKSGKQMNRLLQGDVGSGKTIVAFICVLIAIANGGQAALMAPTEILANQHFQGLSEFAEKMGLKISLLTGSTKTKKRREIHEALEEGALNILVGTHALLEEKVKFKNLGLAIIDEQHRFGVAQRAKLWKKNEDFVPHVLVMTATPIPRTLAMTLYGDLDISVIDELPAGRKPIETVHRYDANRLKVFDFLRKQIGLGRQVYIVYPLIEESAKMDLKHLEDGYESISRAFSEFHLSIVHGKMKADAKEYEMERFVKGETQIMVATTVIEVGVNVPNASVMIIENAERFGLAQLHQLRGRVGRGADQSYCILMSDYKLSKEARIRIDTMVRTNNGFEIADVDLKLRGPGDITGTQQSGLLDLAIADLAKDGQILQLARDAAITLLNKDPELKLPEHTNIIQQINSMKKHEVNWSRVS